MDSIRRITSPDFFRKETDCIRVDISLNIAIIEIEIHYQYPLFDTEFHILPWDSNYCCLFFLLKSFTSFNLKADHKKISYKGETYFENAGISSPVSFAHNPII